MMPYSRRRLSSPSFIMRVSEATSIRLSHLQGLSMFKPNRFLSIKIACYTVVAKFDADLAMEQDQ
jgi:hypothetical protein